MVLVLLRDRMIEDEPKTKIEFEAVLTVQIKIQKQQIQIPVTVASIDLFVDHLVVFVFLSVILYFVYLLIDKFLVPHFVLVPRYWVDTLI